MRFFLFYLILLPLLASSLPYLACYFLDTPVLQGFFSVDVLILLSVLLIPKKNIVLRAFWILALFLYSVFYANTFKEIISSQESSELVNLILAFVYTAFAIITAFIPRNKYTYTTIFTLLALVIFIADASNILYATFHITLAEFWQLAQFFIWGIALFFAIPLLQGFLLAFFSFNFFKQTLNSKDNYPVLGLFLFIFILILNLGVNALQNRERIISMTLKDTAKSFIQTGTNIDQSTFLREDIKDAFPIYQGPKISSPDTNYTSIVMVLVESWGVPKNIDLLKYSFSFFDDVPQSFKGLYLRNVAYTQGAEWEDFNMPQGMASDFTLPKLYQNAHYETWYLHGYDGDFYERKTNYPALGFDSLLFRTELFKRGLKSCKYGYPGICDTSTAAFIAEILSDSTKKYFIYWTTLDAHYPYSLSPKEKESDFCKDFNLNEAECAYYSRQSISLKMVASLAKKFPRTRFIVRGDHRPMMANTPGFVSSFYHRWVPMLILN